MVWVIAGIIVIHLFYFLSFNYNKPSDGEIGPRIHSHVSLTSAQEAGEVRVGVLFWFGVFCFVVLHCVLFFAAFTR